jgi:NAD(P)-dependent dehydrogenase (short-subunit alcohol dehydrogenase family)
MANPSHLSGQVALVTCGSKGIGAAIAQALAAAGASVAATSRSGSGPTAPNLIQIKADVRKPEDAERAVRETVNAFGGLDILVNNAGVGTFGHVSEIAPEEWEQVVGTNLTGVFFCSRAAIPHFRERGGGTIVNVSSLAGKNAFAGGAAYNASKFGLVGMSEAAMLDLRHAGIRVAAICPGSVATELRTTMRQESQDWMLAPEDVAKVVTDLLDFPDRALPSLIELRPTRPPKK